MKVVYLGAVWLLVGFAGATMAAEFLLTVARLVAP
jgi:hypothetical protein